MRAPISVILSHNEKGSDRAKGLSKSIDKRFAEIGYGYLPLDLRFFLGDLAFDVELKTASDYVGSVFSGHLYDQFLKAREMGLPCAGLITEEWPEVMKANKDACLHRGAKDQIGSNYLRLKSFRKRAYLRGIRIFYPGDDSGFFDGEDVWKDLLDMVADIFTDGSLIGFRPRPADNERQVIALATLCKIGPKTAASILSEFGNFAEAIRWLQPHDEAARERLLEIDGVGPKTVAGIWKAMA